MRLLLASLSMLLLLGCSDTPPKDIPLATGESLNILMQAATHTVTVGEILHSGGYTYVKALKDDTAFWVAGPQTDLTVGQTLDLEAQMWMDDFKSSTLGKTFEAILFVQSFEKPTKQAHAQTKLPDMKPLVSIQGSISIKELYAKAKNYDKKSVTMHAKIVKVSRGIMQKNWVHLMDGSSSGDDGVITATTSAENFKVDDTVLVKGTVATDKDFGFGYFYPIIIEDATFSSPQ